MIKYEVNVAERTVTATISGCQDDVKNRLSKNIPSKVFEAKDVQKAMRISESYTAKAKCHPEDTYDEEVGKSVAKAKLLNKYNAARVKALNRVEVVLDRYPAVVSKETQRVLSTFKK